MYHPYYEWEDFKAGMWRKESKEYENKEINKIILFTSDYKKYGQAMNIAVERWPITMEHNLTNPSINYRAFIGHCACCLKYGWPEYLVRRAWRELKESEQKKANNEAEKAYKKWRSCYRRGLYGNMAQKMLF